MDTGTSKVKCEADTQDALLETSKIRFIKSLKADGKAMGQTVREDVKQETESYAGNESVLTFHAGKCEGLAVFLSQNATKN